MRHTVRAIEKDRAGHIWISGEDGAVKLAATGFVRYTAADGVPESPILSVFENRSGALRVVFPRQIVHQFDGTRFTSVQPSLSADRFDVDGLGPAIEDRAGEWWVPGAAHYAAFPRWTCSRSCLAFGRRRSTQRGMGWPVKMFFDSGGLARRHLDRQTSPNRKRPDALGAVDSDVPSMLLKSMSLPRSDGRAPSPRTTRAASGWDSGAVASPVTGTAVLPCSPSQTARRPTLDQSMSIERAGSGSEVGPRSCRCSRRRPSGVRPLHHRPGTHQQCGTRSPTTAKERVLRMTSGVDRLDPVTGAVKHVALPTGWRDVRSKWRSATARHALVRDVSRPGEFRPTAGSPRFPAGGVHRWPAHLWSAALDFELGETHVPALAWARTRTRCRSTSSASALLRPSFATSTSSRARTK